jgi:two-component system chemotaxis response regulator CheY
MKTHHIMIIDDSSAQRWGLRVPLQAEGFKVTEAATGDEALDILKKMNEPLSLIITDQNMPGMSGLQLIESLRSPAGGSYATTPVVVVTSETSVDFQAQCRKLKVLGIINKPVKAEAVVAVVKKSLNIS